MGVDLAGRMSAAVGLGGDGRVLCQLGSTSLATRPDGDNDLVFRPECEYIETVAKLSRAFEVTVVEDVPHALKFMANVKAVVRLQGRLAHAMDVRDRLDRLLFVPPSMWQRSFEGVWRGGPEGAAAAAFRLGYEAPDLHSGLHKEDRKRGWKSETDHVDAFLIATWAREVKRVQGTYDVTGTHRYGHVPVSMKPKGRSKS